MEERTQLYRRQLPHFRDEHVSYFVTWRIREGELDDQEREIVAARILRFQGERYWIGAYVVINDHVHVLFTPLPGFPVEKIIQAWKGFTAYRIHQRRGVRGARWQSEYYDRIVRGRVEAASVAKYIMGNAGKRWPALTERYPWAGCLDFF